MTETDTTAIQDKKPIPNPHPESLPPAAEERGWIHDYVRSPVADTVAHKHT